MADGQQIDYDALSKDKDFIGLSLDQKRAYLSAVDKDFAGLDPESQKGYISHLTGVNVQSMEATPTSRAITAQPTGQLTLRNDLNLPPEASQKTVGNEYNRESSALATSAAATMATGGLNQGPGILRLLARSGTAGASSGAGALAGGATPEEAVGYAAGGAVAQPLAEGATAGVKLLANAPKTVKAIPLQEEWQRINDALGVRPSAIRIGENATDLSQAATMPGRALSKAGLTSEDLAKMTPIEQQRAIQPIRAKAAADLDAAFQKATDEGKSFDVGKSATDVIKKIQNPKAGVDLQQQAIDTFNSLAEEVGIDNQRITTPQQARQLRQLLGYNARFGQGGDLSSLAPIRAELYRAVNRDLHAAAPELQTPDQFYSDVKAGSVAARNGVAKMATKAPEPPPPTFTQQMLETAKKKAIPYTIGGLLGGAAGVAGRKLYDYATAGGTP